jgi:hypothetical protein
LNIEVKPKATISYGYVDANAAQKKLCPEVALDEKIVLLSPAVVFKEKLQDRGSVQKITDGMEDVVIVMAICCCGCPSTLVQIVVGM